ncbi:MAG TPA: DUF229 domain-containing protein [Planctomycetes bacterium]|nr:DUF229 domain-containing protein [Planctomycetota bacterium]
MSFFLFALFLVLGKTLLILGSGRDASIFEDFTSTLIELLPVGVLLLPLVFFKGSPRRLLHLLSGIWMGGLALLLLLAGLSLHKTGSPLDPGEILFVLRAPKEVLPAVLAETGWVQGLGALILFLLFFFLGARPLRNPKTPLVLCFGMIFLGGGARLGLLLGRPRRPELAASLLHRFFPGSKAQELEGSAERGPALLPSPRGYWRSFQEAKPGGPRPNIFLFFMESVRANATSVYNPGLPTTPFLAKWAERSLVAEEAYALTNGTAKELFTAFSGHPPRLTREHVEAGQLPTGSGLPRELVRLGYQTVFFYAALEFHERQLLMMKDLGFQEHFTGPRLAKAFPSVLRFGKRKGEAMDRKRGSEELNLLRNYYGYEDRSLVEPILSWLRKHRDKPWFLSTLNLSTHHPYHPPASWKRRTYPIPKDHPLPGPFQEYLNAVAYLDSVLQELLGRMEEEGFLKNTIVILVGDHGESFKENGFFGHGHGLDENGVRIPLLIFGPERLLGPPRRIRGLRSVLDLVPTLASLLGAEMPQLPSSPLRGCNLLEPVPRDRELFLFAWLNPQKTGLFQGSRRYLLDSSFQRLELYDLARDPLERRDLFSTLNRREVEERWARSMACRREIERFFAEGKAEEIARIRRSSLPKLAKEPRLRIGDSLVLEGVEFPEDVPFFGYGTLRLGFRVLKPLPPSTSLELRLRQKGEVRAPLSLLDPNRLPPSTWRKGDCVLIPVPMFFPNFLVKKGELELELRLVERARGRSLLPSGRSGGEGWISLGRLRVRESSWIPPARSREQVLGKRFEASSGPQPAASYEGKPLSFLLERWKKNRSPRLLAALVPRLREDPAPLEQAYLKGGPGARWALVPLFEALGADAVPSLMKFLASDRRDQALPASEALRRIGFQALKPMVQSILPLPQSQRERVLSWVRGIQVDPGAGLQKLFLDYLGKDPLVQARALVLLSLAPQPSVKMLAYGLPKLEEGEALARALSLVRILGEQAASLRPVLQGKLQKASRPWKARIRETLLRLGPPPPRTGEGK